MLLIPKVGEKTRSCMAKTWTRNLRSSGCVERLASSESCGVEAAAMEVSSTSQSETWGPVDLYWPATPCRDALFYGQLTSALAGASCACVSGWTGGWAAVAALRGLVWHSPPRSISVSGWGHTAMRRSTACGSKVVSVGMPTLVSPASMQGIGCP